MQNRGLGKGLSALIREDNQILIDNSNNVRSNEVEQNIDISSIVPRSDQPRRIFNQEQLNELSESIRLNGIIQPIIVRKIEDNQYQIIAGERRWKAAKMAGLDTVPAVIKDTSDQKTFELSIIENIQRQDLTVVEEAEAYKRLIDDYNYTQEKVAEIIGKSRSHVTNILRLLNLPPEIKEMIDTGQLSMGHARALIGIDNNIEIAQEVISRNLSVRETEKYIKSFHENFSPDIKEVKKKKVTVNISDSSQKDEDLVIIEKHISDKLGMKVVIEDGDEGGTLTISFHNIEQLDHIIKLLSHES